MNFQRNITNKMVKVAKKNLEYSNEFQKYRITLNHPFLLKSFGGEDFLTIFNIKQIDSDYATKMFFSDIHVPIEFHLENEDENSTEINEEIEQHKPYKLYTIIKNVKYYLSVREDEGVYLSSRKVDNNILIEIIHKHEDNIPQLITDENHCLFTFAGTHCLIHEFYQERKHYFENDLYPNFRLQPFRSLRDVGLNQGFRVVYFKY